MHFYLDLTIKRGTNESFLEQINFFKFSSFLAALLETECCHVWIFYACSTNIQRLRGILFSSRTFFLMENGFFEVLHFFLEQINFFKFSSFLAALLETECCHVWIFYACSTNIQRLRGILFSSRTFFLMENEFFEVLHFFLEQINFFKFSSFLAALLETECCHVWIFYACSTNIQRLRGILFSSRTFFLMENGFFEVLHFFLEQINFFKFSSFLAALLETECCHVWIFYACSTNIQRLRGILFSSRTFFLMENGFFEVLHFFLEQINFFKFSSFLAALLETECCHVWIFYACSTNIQRLRGILFSSRTFFLMENGFFEVLHFFLEQINFFKFSSFLAALLETECCHVWIFYACSTNIQRLRGILFSSRTFFLMENGFFEVLHFFLEQINFFKFSSFLAALLETECFFPSKAILVCSMVDEKWKPGGFCFYKRERLNDKSRRRKIHLS